MEISVLLPQLQLWPAIHPDILVKLVAQNVQLLTDDELSTGEFLLDDEQLTYISSWDWRNGSLSDILRQSLQIETYGWSLLNQGIKGFFYWLEAALNKCVSFLSDPYCWMGKSLIISSPIIVLNSEAPIELIIVCLLWLFESCVNFITFEKHIQLRFDAYTV